MKMGLAGVFGGTAPRTRQVIAKAAIPAGTPYPANLGAHGPLRSLEQYLAELREQFDALPMTSPARGALANRIRQVEAEIDAREPL